MPRIGFCCLDFVDFVDCVSGLGVVVWIRPFVQLLIRLLVRAARKQLGDQRKTKGKPLLPLWYQILLHRIIPHQAKPNHTTPYQVKPYHTKWIQTTRYQAIVYIVIFVPPSNAFVPLVHICGSSHCPKKWKSKVKIHPCYIWNVKVQSTKPLVALQL